MIDGNGQGSTRLIWGVIALFHVCFTCGALADCRLSETANGCPVLENEFIRLSLNPRMGGKANSLVFKPTNTEFHGDWGVLVDRLVVNGRRGDNLENKPYDCRILENTKERVSVVFTANGRSSGYKELVFEKTVALNKKQSLVEVNVTFHNRGGHSLPVSYWVFNNFGGRGDESRYLVPTRDGVYSAAAQGNKGDGKGVVGQDRFIYNPPRGWSAMLKPDGTGLVAVVENRYLSCFYNFFSQKGCSVEWLYNVVTLRPGGKWTTHYSLVAFSGLDDVAGANEDCVVAVEIPESGDSIREVKGRVAIAASLDQTVELKVVGKALTAARTVVVESRSVQCEAGETRKVPFNMRLDAKGTWAIDVDVDNAANKNRLNVSVPLIVDEPSGEFRVRPDVTKRIGNTVEIFRKKKGALALDGPRHYEPDDAAAFPCARWAKPYRLGRVDGLFLVPAASGGEVVDLSRRLSLNYNMISDPKALAAALRKAPDALVIGGFAWDKLPVETRALILDHVQKGMGLLFVGGKRVGSSKELVALLNKRGAERCRFAEAFSDSLGVFQDEETALDCDYGKGRIVFLDLGPFSRVGQATLSPIYLNDRGKPKRMPLDVEFEYCYSLLAKAFLKAAGKESPFPLRMCLKESDKNRPIAIDVSVANPTNVTYPWVLDFRIRDQFAELVHKEIRPVSLSPGGKTTVFSIPRLPCGKYFADVICRDNWGQTVDWGTVVFPVSSSTRITGIKTDKPSYGGEKKACCVVSLTREDDGDFSGTLVVRLVDVNGDVVAAKRMKILLSAGEKSFDVELPLTNVVTRSHTVRVDLENGEGDVVARNRKSLVISPSYQPPLLNTVYHCDSQLAPRILCDGIMDYYDTAAQLGLTFVPWTAHWILPLGFGTGGGRLDNNFFDWADPTIRENVARDVKKYATDVAVKHRPPCQILVDEFRASEANLAKYSKSFKEHNKLFREFLKKKYGSLEGLNAQWGTEYKGFDEIVPWNERELNRRIQDYWKTGKLNFSPYFDHHAYWETLMADYVGFLNKSMREVYPDGKMGFSGMAGILGTNPCVDYWKLVGEGNCPFIAMYGGYARDLVSSIKPPGFKLMYWGGYDRTVSAEKKVRSEPWENLFDHGGGIFYYIPTSYSPVFAPDGRSYRSAEWIAEENRDIIENGLDFLVKAAQKSDDGVLVHYSPASIKAAKLADRVGETTGFKLFNAEHSSLNAVLKDIGIQFNYVAYGQIEDEFLDPKIHKVLFLPYSQAMSDEEIGQIKNFVKNGGVVIATLKPAIYDENGKSRGDGGGLDEVFGVRQDALPTYKGQTVSSTVPPFDGLEAEVGEGDPGVELTTGKAMADLPDGGRAVIVNDYGKGKGILLNFTTSDYRRSAAGGVGGEVEIVEKAGEKQAESIRDFYRRLLKMIGVTPRYSVKRQGEEREFPIERVCFELGGSEFLGLLPSYAKENITPADTFETVVAFPEKRHVYDMRRNVYKGYVDALKLPITEGVAEFLALVKRPINNMRIVSDLSDVKRGDMVKIDVKIDGPGAGVLRASVNRPNGENYLKRTILYRDGNAELSFPVPLNAAGGVWVLTVKDPASGELVSTPMTIPHN